MAPDNLLPCPFCGNDELVRDWADLNVRYQRCVQCGCTGPCHTSDAEAVRAWNRRDNPPAISAEECPDCKRQVLLGNLSGTGFLASCGRRLVSIDQCRPSGCAPPQTAGAATQLLADLANLRGHAHDVLEQNSRNAAAVALAKSVIAVGSNPPSDEDWLTDVLNDSLDADWTGRNGAKAILAALRAATTSARQGETK